MGLSQKFLFAAKAPRKIKLKVKALRLGDLVASFSKN